MAQVTKQKTKNRKKQLRTVPNLDWVGTDDLSIEPLREHQGEPSFSGTVGPENTITFSFFFAEKAVAKSQRRKEAEEGPGRGRAAEYERRRQQREWPRRRFSSSATTTRK